MDCFDIKLFVYQLLYALIYEKSMETYDNILINYPNILTEIDNNPWAQKMACSTTDVSQQELVSHVFTMSLLLKLMVL